MENVQSNTESQKLAPRPERFEAWLQNAYENGVMSRETARDLLERYRTEKKGVFAESRTEMRKLSAKVPKKALVGESKRADAKRPERKFGNGESLPEKAPSGIGNAKTESSAPARDVQPGAGDLKKEEVGVLAEYWEAAKELVGVFERHSPKLGMQYVNSADVAAIGLVESGFDPRARNPAGGAGAMQITGHPIRELSRNPAYKPLVTEILEAEGAKSIAAYRNPKELYDLKANAIIGISYAKRCEDIPPLPDSLFKKMCGMKDHLSKVSWRMLASKSIRVVPDEMSELLDKLADDRTYQERFKVFYHYNGNRKIYSRHWQVMPHQSYYALTCLYLSENSFGKLGKPEGSEDGLA